MKKKNLTFYFFIIVLLAVIICSAVLLIKKNKNETPDITGNYIERDDAILLFSYLCLTDEELVSFQSNSFSFDEINMDLHLSDDSYISKEVVNKMFQILKEKYPVYSGEIEILQEKAFSDYRDKSLILAYDYLEQYEALWSLIHSDLELSKNEYALIGTSEDVTVFDDDMADFVQMDSGFVCLYDPKECDSERFFIANMLYNHLESDSVDEERYALHKFYSYQNCILADLSKYYEGRTIDIVIPSAFVVSNTEEILLVEFNNFRIQLDKNHKAINTENGAEYNSFENIIDLHIKNGELAYVCVYDDYISGKLLCIDDDTIEIEGVGKKKYKTPLPVYKLYGKKEFYSKKDLKIGYDFTDFVLNEKGEIVAGLIAREENMDKIRVVVKTSGFSSAYHQSVILSCDQDFMINDEYHLAGEEITISCGDEILKNGRIFLRPSTNLAKTKILSIERNQGPPSYRGNFEIVETKDGILIINEVLLEEYLYSVVPSEMPASYPKEALKAQAICARTYAYDKMMHSNLFSYGAHVDDSAAFQVYNNIQESESTTIAIRETQGQIMTLNSHPAEIYYYSTSCGYGTTIDAWHGSNTEKYRYMASKHIANTEVDSANIEDENVFREYLNTDHPEDYECEEAFYRWTYDTNLNVELLNQSISKRYEASPKSILTLNSDGSYSQKNPPDFSAIQRLDVVKRASGGIMDELVISGKEGCVKIIGEHNIRAVLVNESDYAIKKDGNKTNVTSLLPSAFAYIDVNVSDESNSILSYHLVGGGYGHGIGMSQNAAKGMANSLYSCDQILAFFFEGIEISVYNK